MNTTGWPLSGNFWEVQAVQASQSLYWKCRAGRGTSLPARCCFPNVCRSPQRPCIAETAASCGQRRRGHHGTGVRDDISCMQSSADEGCSDVLGHKIPKILRVSGQNILRGTLDAMEKSPTGRKGSVYRVLPERETSGTRTTT